MVDDGQRVTIEEGVTFGTGGDRDLLCDIYTPPHNTGDSPAVLLVHGGGWRSGDRQQLRGYGLRLGREGYVCVASEYRLRPDAAWPAQIEDVKAAIRWMRANSDRLGIDPSQIAIEGNSAGAHLALLAAGTPNLPEFEGEGGNAGAGTEVAAAIGVYTPTEFALPEGRETLNDHILLGTAGADVAAAASPITYASADFPPTLLIHGNADTTVPPKQSEIMYDALVAAGSPVELQMFADQPHAFDAAPAFARQCASTMAFFLQRYVVERAGAGNVAEAPARA